VSRELERQGSKITSHDDKVISKPREVRHGGIYLCVASHGKYREEQRELHGCYAIQYASGSLYRMRVIHSSGFVVHKEGIPRNGSSKTKEWHVAKNGSLSIPQILFKLA
jgi:hypothetical protein